MARPEAPRPGLTADIRLPRVVAFVAKTKEDSEAGRREARKRQVQRLRGSLAFRLFQEAAVILQDAFPDVVLTVTDPNEAVHMGAYGVDARLKWGFNDRGEDFRGGPRYAWSEARISYRTDSRAPHKGMVLNVANDNDLSSGIPVHVNGGPKAMIEAVQEAIVNPMQQAGLFIPRNEGRKVVAIG